MARLTLVLAALLLAGCGSSAAVAPPPPVANAPTASPTAPFAVVTPTPEPDTMAAVNQGTRSVGRRAGPAPRHRARFRIARVVRPTALRSAPGGRRLSRVKTATEFGSAMILSVVRARGAWLKVRTAALPNGQFGWIRAADTTRHGTDYAIVVDRSEHQAVLRHNGHDVFTFAVAVGRPGNETPLGQYAVTDKLRTTDASSPYGCCALALTGHQTQLEPGWPGGDRLAIHGTPDETSVGQAVSLGCMRAYGSALHRLLRRVPLGAPVVVRA